MNKLYHTALKVGTIFRFPGWKAEEGFTYTKLESGDFKDNETEEIFEEYVSRECRVEILDESK